MSNEPSPRPWQVRYGDMVADATGARVAACWRPENAALIVDAVNNIDRLRDELDVERSQHCTDIEQAEYHAEHHRKSLEAERDRLRDALDEIRHRASVALGCPMREEEAVALLVHNLLGIKECARAALGEDASP